MTVHLLPWDTDQNLLLEANRLYDKAKTFSGIKKNDLVAIKIHVGELGNPYYVQPFFIHEIIRRVKEMGAKPFLTDSNTLYPAQRHDAYDHMNTALMNGFNMAPFIVADGLKSENSQKFETKGFFKEIEVAGAIAQADAMIVVSHCKGHELSGFGGAIKNIAMGCTSKTGKLRQHRAIGLEIDIEKCIGCRKCKKTCTFHYPDLIEGKARITSTECMRCPMCKAVCPVEAISFKDKPNLSLALASAAYGVLSTFKPEKVSYVSFAKDISQYCDCAPTPGEIVTKDVGIFAADSCVSIDAAFLNSIDYSRFNEEYEVDCMLQVKELKTLGIAGDLKPKIEVLA